MAQLLFGLSIKPVFVLDGKKFYRKSQTYERRSKSKNKQIEQNVLETDSEIDSITDESENSDGEGIMTSEEKSLSSSENSSEDELKSECENDIKTSDENEFDDKNETKKIQKESSINYNNEDLNKTIIKVIFYFC
jgi:hypothetical protein